MKVIETKFAGCHFRSRQEARWAVFFQELDIPWHYEAEGYELPNTGRYLPDFWLPSLNCFFEVKGATPTPAELTKAHELSAQSGKLVAIASGQTKTSTLRVGSMAPIEWPVQGFKIVAFGGHAWNIETYPTFAFSLWHWQMSTDLPPFIAEQYPEENLPVADSLEKRRRLVELDQHYYRTKYGKEHPKYLYGRSETVYWVSSGPGKLVFAGEPEHEPSLVAAAYRKAQEARFEFG